MSSKDDKYYGNIVAIKELLDSYLINEHLKEGWEILKIESRFIYIMGIRTPAHQPQKPSFTAEVSTTATPPQVQVREETAKPKEEYKAKVEEEKMPFTKSFKACKYCEGLITIIKRNEKWIALNPDESDHHCGEKK